MRCSFCSLPAEFKSAFSQKFMCQTHIGTHLMAIGNQRIELLNIDLGNKKLNSLRSKILKKVEKVNRVKNDITIKTRTLIKSIEKLFKVSLAKLDAFSNSYLWILKQNRFTESDMDTILKIEKMDFGVKAVDIEKIKKQIELEYSQEFIEYEDERKRKIEEKKIKKKQEEEKLHPEKSNSYTEMNLRQKIDYFYPIVLKKYGRDLNSHQECKEALVSNDGKYLFYCKLY